MPKLGKPGMGYHAIRQMTKAEQRVTGEYQRWYLMQEAGTGKITLWEPQGDGFNRGPTGERAWQITQALEQYWET